MILWKSRVFRQFILVAVDKTYAFLRIRTTSDYFTLAYSAKNFPDYSSFVL
jgi:hypothetical protein